MPSIPLTRYASFVVLSILLSGCGVRSISNSSYEPDADRWGARSYNPFYRGELAELDVLGLDREVSVSEEDINRALISRAPLSLKKGIGILLIQSGAVMPDDPMVKALERHYNVAVFSGVPLASGQPAGQQGSPTSYARTLRLAAARGGYEKIVAYWGLIETAQENLATKTVSWVPIVGWTLPDEQQRMRIRLKVAVVDVRTGSWDMFSPEPFEERATSARYSRASSDQHQVSSLKQQAYWAAADDIVKRYAR